MSKDYYLLLKDPRWQQKRLEILSRDNWTCFHCWQKFEELHVHHIMYLKNADGSRFNPWEYPPHYLIALCHQCHKFAHMPMGFNDALMDFIKPFMEQERKRHWQELAINHHLKMEEL